MVRVPVAAALPAEIVNGYVVGPVVQGTVNEDGDPSVRPVPLNAPVMVVPDGSGLPFASLKVMKYVRVPLTPTPGDSVVPDTGVGDGVPSDMMMMFFAPIPVVVAVAEQRPLVSRQRTPLN